MNARSRKALQPIYQSLPAGFSGEVYDDFVNFNHGHPGNALHSRVLRFVGPSRHIVLFSSERDWAHSARYSLLFLHMDGSLVPFDVKQIEGAWRKAGSTQIADPHRPFPWDREVAKWLSEHGARAFTGRNWTGEIAEVLVTLLPLWRKEHSGLEDDGGHE